MLKCQKYHSIIFPVFAVQRDMTYIVFSYVVMDILFGLNSS
jgi:hypothetical protein